MNVTIRPSSEVAFAPYRSADDSSFMLDCPGRFVVVLLPEQSAAGSGLVTALVVEIFVTFAYEAS